MGTKEAVKLLDDLRAQQKEVPPITDFKDATQEDLQIMSMPITYRDMYKILDALAEPDKIEKGELKIPKGQQDEWDAEYAKDQAELDAAYNEGYRQFQKDFTCLMEDNIDAFDVRRAKGAADELGRMSAVCPHCNLSINHPPDCPNNTEGPKESPAFGVRDIVETQDGNIAKVVEIGATVLVMFRGGCSGQYNAEYLKLLFPLSRVPKELKLSTGEIIRCESRGTIVELSHGLFGLVTGIDEDGDGTMVTLGWYPDKNKFISMHRYIDEIKRVVWQMEESK